MEEDHLKWKVNYQVIQPRDYQIELAKQILKTKSTILVMPTALGKTYVTALLIGAMLVEKPSMRAIFLAPTKPLSVQQGQRMSELVALNTTNGGIEVLTGEVGYEQRSISWKTAQIVVATPQTCLSDVLANRLDLAGFDLLILDECHRAVRNYAYGKLGKLAQEKNLKVLGLTASPSSNRSKIEEIKQNLGAQNIIIKTEDDPQISNYLQKVEVEWTYLDLPESIKEIKKMLFSLLEITAKPLATKGYFGDNYSAAMINKRTLLNLQIKLITMIKYKNPSAYSALTVQGKLMNIIHAIDLLESEGLYTMLEFLKSMRTRKQTSKAVKLLLEEPVIAQVMAKAQEFIERGEEHPKYQKTLEIVSQAKNENKKTIVFAHYRSSIAKIVQTLKANQINAIELVGKSNSGMNQKEQGKAVENFRNGMFDVLVASSVAEEGLDIPSVDLVIFFEPVSSEIRLIQRRGRAGRVKAGRVLVLIAKETKDEAIFWLSRKREEMMHQTLKKMEEKQGGETLQTSFENGNKPKHQKKLFDF